MNNPDTAVVSGGIQHRGERLDQKRLDMLKVVRGQAGLLEEQRLLSIGLVWKSVILVFFRKPSLQSDRADSDRRSYREIATLSAGTEKFGEACEWIESAAQLALICGQMDYEIFLICEQEFQWYTNCEWPGTCAAGSGRRQDV